MRKCIVERYILEGSYEGYDSKLYYTIHMLASIYYPIDNHQISTAIAVDCPKALIQNPGEGP
ncbi:hypothetical protein TNIN_409861, partial [Trichonephila inaurata madagascariensis]